MLTQFVLYILPEMGHYFLQRLNSHKELMGHLLEPVAKRTGHGVFKNVGQDS